MLKINEQQWEVMSNEVNVVDIENFGCDATGQFSVMSIWYEDGTDVLVEVDHFDNRLTEEQNEIDAEFASVLKEYNEKEVSELASSSTIDQYDVNSKDWIVNEEDEMDFHL